MTKDAVLLGGPLGLGHEMMARSCAEVLERSGWRTRRLDSMSLLGPWHGAVGAGLFHRLVAVPGLYDGLHFAHLRTGSRLADLMDRAASARLVPALRAELDREPADLIISVFATGASAAAKLKAEVPGLRTVVLCTDVAVHRMWVAEGTDLFLVTSPAAAASVRRYLPRAAVAIVPPSVRSAFYSAPTQEQAKAAIGVPSSDFCVLVIDSGWGFGPLVESVLSLAEAGVHVLAVAGRDRRIELPIPGTGRPDAPDHAVRLYRPDPGTDGRRRPRHRPARRHDLQRGPGRGARAAAPRRHARAWARQPAARAGAGRSTRVRSNSSRGYRQRACPARRWRWAGAAGPHRRRAGRPPSWRPCSGSAWTCSLPPRRTSPSRPRKRPDHQ